jgi:hypothetical protein
MAGITTTAANYLLRHIFWNEDFPGIGDTSGLQNSTTTGSLYVILFSASPGAAGNATTNELGYTGYARIQMPRNNSTWAITNNVVSPVATITFGQCTGGTIADATHWGVTDSASSTGSFVIYGALNATITMASLVTPRLTTASTITIPTS